LVEAKYEEASEEEVDDEDTRKASHMMHKDKHNLMPLEA